MVSFFGTMLGFTSPAIACGIFFRPFEEALPLFLVALCVPVPPSLSLWEFRFLFFPVLVPRTPFDISSLSEDSSERLRFDPNFRSLLSKEVSCLKAALSSGV